MASTGRVQVAPGQTIASATWGNPLWDHSVQCFETTSDRDTAFPVPQEGAVVYIVTTRKYYAYQAGGWRDWQVTPVVQAYTPAWEQTPSGTVLAIGNGTLDGQWVQQGKLVTARINLIRGSTTNTGTEAYVFGLPAAAPAQYLPGAGSGIVTRGTASTFIPQLVNSTRFAMVRTSDFARLSNTVPGSWATGDVIVCQLQYFTTAAVPS